MSRREEFDAPSRHYEVVIAYRDSAGVRDHRVAARLRTLDAALRLARGNAYCAVPGYTVEVFDRRQGVLLWGSSSDSA